VLQEAEAKATAIRANMARLWLEGLSWLPPR
jgi:hypothetical protein